MDHGVWTPLYVMFPKADVPVVSLSVRSDLDPRAHILAGRLLAPLRKEGILLLGSGEAVHNVHLMGERTSPRQPWCVEFEGWIEDTILASPPSSSSSSSLSFTNNLERDAVLAKWKTLAPSADIAHPPGISPGEHLMPLLFAYGCAGEDRGRAGRCVHKEYLGSLPMAAYEFGGAGIEDGGRGRATQTTKVNARSKGKGKGKEGTGQTKQHPPKGKARL